MANASWQSWVVGAPSTVPVPAAGSAAPAIDASNHLYTKDSSSNIWIADYATSTRAASSAINSSETVITQAASIPVGLLQVGTGIRITGSGICTTTVANVSTFTFRAGTLGTTGDQSIATATVTAGTTGTNIPFNFILQLTVDAVGASGTCKGYFLLQTSATTGISTALYNRVQIAGTTLATTTVTNLELTYKAAASTTTSTFDAAVCLEVLPV